jgi:hypothetical protein
VSKHVTCIELEPNIYAKHFHRATSPRSPQVNSQAKDMRNTLAIAENPCIDQSTVQLERGTKLSAGHIVPELILPRFA